MKARAQLMRVLQKTVRGWNISQKAAADRLGYVTAPERSIARQDRQVQFGCAIRSRGTGGAQGVDRAAQGGMTLVA